MFNKKHLEKFVFSIPVSITLLLIFAVSIAYATFVESKQGTEIARNLVYNAVWFEVLLVLLIVNLCGSIFKYQLINKKKWTVLMFHLAFICILAGSAITRYFGYEGIMHIRQGETSNLISLDKTGIHVEIDKNGQKTTENYDVHFSADQANQFAQDIQVGNKTIHIENKMFVPNAIETLTESESGKPAVGIFLMSGAESSSDFTLWGDDPQTYGNVTFGFSGNKNTDISFSIKNNELYFSSKNAVSRTGMDASGMIDRKNAIDLAANTDIKAEENTVYRTGKVVFMIRGYYAKATNTLAPASSMSDEMSNVGRDACQFSVSDGKTTKQVNVFENENSSSDFATCTIDGYTVKIAYGKLAKELPFSLTLKKFELDRYPGSMSPSSYASEITLTDQEYRTVRPYRIYMNNILNYRGYRFFQSSYDDDEMGTILSVNHDYLGTLVTYVGYFFMFLGMILTFFNKNSRFRSLLRQLNQLQSKRKSLVILLLALSSITTSLLAGTQEQEHIDKLSKILIQNEAQGRIEPFGSYAADVIRKIYKHDTYKNQSAALVLMEMSADPDHWRDQIMIKVAHDGLANELGAVNGYVSYNQLFDSNGNYKLAEQVDQAYRKEEAQRNKYEKEIINVDERINICTEIYMHNFLALFPDKNTTDGHWKYSDIASNESAVTSTGQTCPYVSSGGKSETMPEAMQAEDTLNMSAMSGHCTRNDAGNPHAGLWVGSTGLFETYLSSVKTALSNDNWQPANESLNKIVQYQQKYGGSSLPSATRVNLEILYNKLDVFLNLMIVYAIIGIILLLLHFWDILKPNSKLEKVLQWGIYPLGLLFIIYTLGLAMRWYVSGHAPWSNGYESMVFVGWATSLSGFLFARKSPLAFSLTAILAAIALSVAAMSWMNPEITNLVPVLKSYWLIVHVAVITSSYGFLAMGAMLGLLNLILICLRKPKNEIRINGILKEISLIIELSLIIGLFMLTIGTFLGGIWANESWGRYWGWDPKETWALVSVLVYAIIVHLRMIPKLNNFYVLSTAALLGFGSVIMTFVGVNYYLTGMHSYGQGNPPAIPAGIYVALILLFLIVYGAYLADKKYRDQKSK